MGNSACTIPDYRTQFFATPSEETSIFSTYNIIKLSFEDSDTIKSIN